MLLDCLPGLATIEASCPIRSICWDFIEHLPDAQTLKKHIGKMEISDATGQEACITEGQTW